MTKKNVYICLILVILTTFVGLNYSRQATVDIYMKSLKIWHLKEIASINMSRCGFKTTRKIRTGLLSCEGLLLKRLDTCYLQVKLFYKYGTIYRDYLFNYKKIEVCDLMANKRNVKYSNPLADLARRAITNCCPQLDHECPYMTGWYNATNIDINGTFAPLLPPVVPAGEFFYSIRERQKNSKRFDFVGQFKIYLRGFLEENVTAVEIEASVVIKANHANRAGDFSMLAMG